LGLEGEIQTGEKIRGKRERERERDREKSRNGLVLWVGKSWESKKVNPGQFPVA